MKIGPTTSVDLAARTGTQERYVREWLGAMANAGYLEYDPTSGRYTLPPEHAPVLAQETGPVFFGGVHEEFVGLLGCLEINCSDKPEQNQGPIGALLQSCSVLLCLTLSLSGDGEGLGTLGLHEPKLRELAAEAGFSSVERIPMENPFNNLYELTR